VIGLMTSLIVFKISLALPTILVEKIKESSLKGLLKKMFIFSPLLIGEISEEAQIPGIYSALGPLSDGDSYPFKNKNK